MGFPNGLSGYGPDQYHTVGKFKACEKLEFWICYRKSAMGIGIFGGEFIRDQTRFSLAIGGTYCAVREVVKVRQTM